MAQDLVSLYNMACSAIGTKARISLPTEKSREAEICQLWYPTVRDTVLSAAHWSSARAVASLALLADRDLNVGWVDVIPRPIGSMLSPCRAITSTPATSTSTSNSSLVSSARTECCSAITTPQPFFTQNDRTTRFCGTPCSIAQWPTPYPPRFRCPFMAKLRAPSLRSNSPIRRLWRRGRTWQTKISR